MLALELFVPRLGRDHRAQSSLLFPNPFVRAPPRGRRSLCAARSRYIDDADIVSCRHGPDRQGPNRQDPDRQSPDRQGPNRQRPDSPGPDKQGLDRVCVDRYRACSEAVACSAFGTDSVFLFLRNAMPEPLSFSGRWEFHPNMAI